MLDNVLQGYANAMRCEHRQIEKLLHHLERCLDHMVLNGRTAAGIRSVAEQVEVLEKSLKCHFQREEEGGFLDDAVAAAPRCATVAEGLLDEHATLLTRVHELAKESREQLNTKQANWPSFAAALRNVIRQLKSHEERENELLRRAFNLANGA